jgi:hypothetical protein
MAVADDCQHIPDPGGLQLAAQPSAGAIDLVAGHQAAGVAGVDQVDRDLGVFHPPGSAGAGQPGQSAQRPGPTASSTPPASGQDRSRLRCGPRPPSDLRLSTYHRIINGGRPAVHSRSGRTRSPQPSPSKVTNYGRRTSRPEGCGASTRWRGPGSQAEIGEAGMICRPWTCPVPVELPL